MVKKFEVFFSNHLEVLYHHLKISLFKPTATPLMRRLVVVYGPAMKTWLMLKMAQDPELTVAMGIEFIYLNQAFELLLKLSSPENQGHFPTQLELALAIEKECLYHIQNFKNLAKDEQRDWQPLLRYLKLNPHHLGPKLRLTLKMEKRLISLSQHLARLFQDYGRYGLQMVAKWEMPGCTGWQPHLWRKLFCQKGSWTYPARALQQRGNPAEPFTVLFFSISFITACEFSFLNRLSEHVPLTYCLLSPCAVFWSDIRSDREATYLQTYWQQKVGTFSPKIFHLEEFLRDRNPLLANFGRLGREMACQIEESQALSHAHYILPQHVQTLNEELCHQEDLYLTETSEPLTLLHALQADLLLMRNPQNLPSFNLEEEKNSLQLHIAPSRRREVQILYHNLLGLIANDPSLCPSDIIVMTPQIADYVPYIQGVFGVENSRLDLQILDLGMQTQSEIVQAFLQLLELSESRWNASQLLQLFEHSSFQRCHQLSSSDYATIQEWVEQVGICWGEDEIHRNELLLRKHCEQGMVEETTIGTWDYGLSRLLFGLTTILDNHSQTTLEVLPCASVDFSQGELLGKWMRLLHSLRDDLSLLHDRTRMTMEDWVNYLICLLDNYFQPDFNLPSSLEEHEDLKAQFEVLRHSARFFKDTLFPFTSIKTHLLTLLQQRGITYREDHLQAVRFCSLMPLRSIPAKVIAILGLQEGSFPRPSQHSSLNLMSGEKETDYCPLSTDYDRYLFLEALHAAQDCLLLSYQGYGQHDGKELQPSLIVEELVSYLDKFYTIHREKFSQKCIFKHPFDSFDDRYFAREKCLYNFSQQDYLAAQTVYKKDKIPPHCFLNGFTRVDPPQPHLLAHNSQIDLKHLAAAARNPIKFHLNKVLEIYLQTEEDRKLKNEEALIVSSLDKYQLRHSALTEPIEKVLFKAEKEGKLPFGLFKTVAIKRLKEEVDDMHMRLKKYAIDPSHIFQIEFCTSCSQPTQLEEDRWLFPAVTLTYENEYQLSVVGKLHHVTPKGLVVLSKGTLADAWKVWPQFLLYCYAAKLCPQKLEPQLILLQASQPKKAFFDHPELYLKQFIHYYTLCLQNFSPLLPEWLPLILEGDASGLEDKMSQVFTESFGVYPHHDLRWILHKHHLPCAATLVEEWKEQAKILLGDLVHFWYPCKLEKVCEDV